MVQAYYAQINLVGFNFNPSKWKYCQGEILNIQDEKYPNNQAVYSLIGTIYGGDGRVNFALPNLASRIAKGADTKSLKIGDKGGQEKYTLTSDNLLPHSHQIINSDMEVSAQASFSLIATYTQEFSPGASDTNLSVYNSFQDNVTTSTTLNPDILQGSLSTKADIKGDTESTGEGQPFTLLSPYLGMNYVICIDGLYPLRN